MNDTIIEPASSSAHDRDDRWLAGIGYGLFILGNLVGLTTLIAAIIAYARKDTATNLMHSHYAFQIQTFWGAVLGGAVCLVLIVTVLLSPFGLLGFAALWIWVLIRSVVGLLRLFDGRGIGDPSSLWI